MHDTVERFQRALQELERGGDDSQLIELFADDAEIGNVATEGFRGREGAREFFRAYLSSFGQIRSRFTRVAETDGSAFLEWTSEGKGPDGAPMRYDGVTVLGIEGDRIVRFHAYFDPRALGRQLEVERGRSNGAPRTSAPSVV